MEECKFFGESVRNLETSSFNVKALRVAHPFDTMFKVITLAGIVSQMNT